MDRPFDVSIENFVRKSHCDHAHKGRPDHKCVGSCTIKPNGIELSCTLCGKGDIYDYANSEVRSLMGDLIRDIGFSSDTLSEAATQRACIRLHKFIEAKEQAHRLFYPNPYSNPK